MPDNEIDWDELDRISAEKRRKSLERTQKAISEAMRDSSGIDRLEAIPDDVWQAAVEVDDDLLRQLFATEARCKVTRESTVRYRNHHIKAPEQYIGASV